MHHEHMLHLTMCLMKFKNVFWSFMKPDFVRITLIYASNPGVTGNLAL